MSRSLTSVNLNQYIDIAVGIKKNTLKMIGFAMAHTYCTVAAFSGSA
jgi:hypothetical protein